MQAAVLHAALLSKERKERIKVGHSPTDVAGIDSSSRTCRIGAVEVEDRFAPAYTTSVLPTPSEMRAFRAGNASHAVVSPGAGQAAAPQAQALRFHPPVWSALSSGSLKPEEPKSQAPPSPEPISPAAKAPETSTLYAPAEPKGFSPALWYAQAASFELHQKQSQLSHRALKVRIQTQSAEGE